MKAEEAAASFEDWGFWTIHLAAPDQQMPATLEFSYWLPVHDRMSRADGLEHTVVRSPRRAAVQIGYPLALAAEIARLLSK